MAQQNNGWRKAGVIIGILIPVTILSGSILIKAFQIGGAVTEVQRKVDNLTLMKERQDRDIDSNEDKIHALEQQGVKLGTNQDNILKMLEKQDGKIDQILKEMRTR